MTAGILRPDKPDQVASEGGKKRGIGGKTIEHFDVKGCRSSGSLMWLTFRSLIARVGQTGMTGWLLKS
jgi:hypothetical protein